MKQILLSDEDYEQLLHELHSLWTYHYNDDSIHVDDCGSRVVETIIANTTTPESPDAMVCGERPPK